MPISGQLRQILRRLALSPLFTTVSVVTLALAIGANSAVFSVIQGVLLEPLPYPEPERLVGVWHEAPGLGFERLNQSPATYLTYRDEGRAFEDIGMWDSTQVTVTGLDKPERVAGMLVTDGTFPVLGIYPAVGRTFTAEDDAPGSTETAILGYGYWQNRFDADPGVLGTTLIVDGRVREIIGVMPETFRFLDYQPDVYLPFRFDRSEVFFGNFSYQAIARLREGATIDEAGADVTRMIPVAAGRFPLPGGLTMEMLQEARLGANIRPLKLDVVGDVGNVLWVLFGTVGLVLLIACANVANLFLVRGEGRQRESAIRTALGASRRRVAGEFLLESLTLGVLGGLAGLGLAWAGLRLLVLLGPDTLPRLDEIGLDPAVLLFTLAISLVAGIVFGGFPALKLAGVNLAHALRDESRGSSSGRDRHRLRNTLVVAQIALALVLLIGSGLMIRSFLALRSVHPGFIDPQEVLTLRVAVPEAEVEDPQRAARTYEQIFQNVQAIPGIGSVGMSSSITMDGWDSNDPIFVEDSPAPEGQLPALRRFKWIAPGYFETMGNPVLAGRPISWADIHDIAEVVVVTENFVQEYWDTPSQVIGRRIRANPDSPWREIVGVVGNVHDDGVAENATAVIYWPMVVSDFWGEGLFTARFMAFAIRTPRLGSPSLMPEIQEAIWSVNPNLALASVRTLEEILQRSMARTSFTLIMLGIAAGVALLLGAVGIYGVISYSAAQRTREIGVRIALGARQEDVSRLVLRQGLVLATVGVAFGLAAAVALTRVMSALLFGVEAVDPLTYAGVAVGLALVALIASYLPARRAAKVDPIRALHC